MSLLRYVFLGKFTDAVVKALEKRAGLQSKQWIFVGGQQFIFVYLLLTVPIFLEIIFLAKTPNIFSFCSIALFIFALTLVLLRRVGGALVPLFLSLVTTYFGPGGRALVFILPLIAIPFILSIINADRILKRPWDEIENILIKQGRSKAEIDKTKEYWQQKRKN